LDIALLLPAGSEAYDVALAHGSSFMTVQVRGADIVVAEDTLDSEVTRLRFAMNLNMI
jgi:hypothetical protein